MSAFTEDGIVELDGWVIVVSSPNTDPSVLSSIYSSKDWAQDAARAYALNAMIHGSYAIARIGVNAAAPEMYGALEEALAWMETVEADAVLPHQFDSAPIAQARAALSRVKG